MPINKLDDIVNKCTDIYHITIKMKPIYIKPNIYVDLKVTKKVESNKEHRISKYKNIFAKGYAPNFSEEVFVIKKS